MYNLPHERRDAKGNCVDRNSGYRRLRCVYSCTVGHSLIALAPGAFAAYNHIRLGNGGAMNDPITRFQHYVDLAAKMREVAQGETDIKRKNELLDLARQYDRLSEKLAAETRH